MKQVRFSVAVLWLAIGALLIAGGNQVSAADNGRLVIRRSPVLGHNVRIDLTIDGKSAGTLGRGRTYDMAITPGRHTLTASPSRSGEAWHGTLEVRPGETYTYTASFNVDKLVLTLVKSSR